jgi:hypothetical protein
MYRTWYIQALYSVCYIRLMRTYLWLFNLTQIEVRHTDQETLTVLRIRDVLPGSPIQGQKESRIRIRIKEFKYFNLSILSQKIVSTLSKI